MATKQHKKSPTDKGTPVQPLESVEKAPLEPNKSSRKENTGEICWNCKNHDPKTSNRLDDNGICEVCGFDKTTLYNGNIEADKVARRVEAAQAAERGF